MTPHQPTIFKRSQLTSSTLLMSVTADLDASAFVANALLGKRLTQIGAVDTALVLCPIFMLQLRVKGPLPVASRIVHPVHNAVMLKSRGDGAARQIRLGFDNHLWLP
jgi:hypothetical protein